MPSVEELLNQDSEEVETYADTGIEYCTVDDDTRLVTVPDKYKKLGVESDEKAKRIWFRFPKLVGNNGVDLSAIGVRVNFRNANGEGDIYIVEDLTTDGDYVTFSWELTRKVTAYKGNVSFVVCAVKSATDGTIKNEWNTTLNKDCEVLEGLEVTEQIAQENPDIIEYILANLGGSVSSEEIAQAVEAYMEKNPSSGMTADEKAQLNKNTEDISSLSEEIANLKESGTGTVVASNDLNITKWKGKKIVVDGSSITAGGTGETKPTWSDYLKEWFGLYTVYNHAGSGTGWTSSGSTTVITRMLEYEDDADAVILMGDYNGIYGYMQGVGNIDDEPSSDGSYYARLKYIAEYLINKYPLCPIIWVAEPPRSNPTDEALEKTPMGYDSVYAKQNECIETVAEYYGFPHCNLMKNTVFRPWIQANYNVTTADGTHPYNIIQHTMAQVIAETMKRTPLLYGYEAPDTPIEPDVPEVTLSSISATYTGGEVTVGTVLTDLTGIAVKATYSDGSTKNVTDYTLSGTIAEGSNTITVSYGGLTTTFTVTGIAESSGGNTVNPTTEAVKVFEGYYGINTNANYNNYVITDVRVGDVLTFFTNWNAKATDNSICCYLNSLPDSQPTNYSTDESLGKTTAYLDSNAVNQNYAYGIATHTVVQDSQYFIFTCHKDHLSEATWVKVERN